MYECFKNLSQRQLGEIFGVSSHKIGRWLKEIALRTESGKPTDHAIEEGFCSEASPDDSVVFTVWDREKTVKALEHAGHQRMDRPIRETISGPFSVGSDNESKVGIKDVNGTTCIWARDERLAESLVKLLNLAHEFGKFPKITN